jgi:type I restriction enzyme S subunit
MPAIDVSPAQWAIIKAILEHHVPGVAVIAFGSRARWQAEPFSDLDLALCDSGPISLSTLASLEHDLTESDLPFRVDIVDWHRLDEGFRRVIDGDRVTVLPASPK